jgi:hypothetical protein
MAQNKKTPSHLAKLIGYTENQALWMTEKISCRHLLHDRSDKTNPGEEPTVEQLIARQEGYNCAVETVLMEYGCYAGFAYIAATPRKIEGTDETFIPTIGQDHPEFAEWRRRYFVK